MASPGPWRLELFFKSNDELAQQVPFLRAHNLTRLNLPNKVQNQDLVGAVKTLASSGMLGLDICVHYVSGGGALPSAAGPSAGAAAARRPARRRLPARTPPPPPTGEAPPRPPPSPPNPTLTPLPQSVHKNYERSPAGAAAKLDAVYAALQAACPPGASLSLLLVSGSGPKKRYDSVAAVQQLGRRHKQPPVPLHVAFNPYLPEGLGQEKERLRAKLAGGRVAGVYLQIGTDLARLEAALQQLGALMDEVYGAAPRPAIHGCAPELAAARCARAPGCRACAPAPGCLLRSCAPALTRQGLAPQVRVPAVRPAAGADALPPLERRVPERGVPGQRGGRGAADARAAAAVRAVRRRAAG